MRSVDKYFHFSRILLTLACALGFASQGIALEPTPNPSLAVTPERLDVSLIMGTTTTRSLTLSNNGTSPVTWHLGASTYPMAPTASGSAGGAPATAGSQPPLEDVLARLNLYHTAITARITDRFDFTEGVVGNHIVDGGDDMYDNGNYLSTNLSPTFLDYSDNLIASAPASLGTGGRYFTRKFQGLFVFAADVAGVSTFNITGELGADGVGSADSNIYSETRGGVIYRAFVKRVSYSTSSSVNQIIIVADNSGTVDHSASTNTNDDRHNITGLTNTTRIYYLLCASTDGAYLDDFQTMWVCGAFLDAIGIPGPITYAPASGVLAPGATQAVTVNFDATYLVPDIYNRSIDINSDAPALPVINVPIVMTVTDRVLHHFEFEPLPASLVRGTPATFRIHARDAASLPVTRYNAPVTITANGTTMTPVVTDPYWSNGSWSGQVTPMSFATSAKLNAVNGANITGTSSAFAVRLGAIYQLLWGTVPSPQAIDRPFSVSLQTADQGGNPLTSYSGPVQLFTLSPQIVETPGPSNNAIIYPLVGSYTSARNQVLYPPSTLGSRPRRLTSLSLSLVGVVDPKTFLRWTIRLKNSPKTTLADGSFDEDGWTTVHVSTLRVTRNGWITCEFTAPFDYDGTGSLLVEFSHWNTAGGVDIYSEATYVDQGVRSLYRTFTNPVIDPLIGYTNSRTLSYVPIIRFTSLEPTVLQPGTVNLVNGVWQGTVSTGASGKLTQLHASIADTSVFGDSNTFTVPAPIIPGARLPYSQTWEANVSLPFWTYTGDGSYRVTNTTENTPHSGLRHLVLDNASMNSPARSEATLMLNLAGRSGVVLKFWGKRTESEALTASGTTSFYDVSNFDGIAISADGLTWYELENAFVPTAAWKLFTVNLDAFRIAKGLTYNSTFRIRFNRYGQYYAPAAFIAIDDLSVTADAPPPGLDADSDGIPDEWEIARGLDPDSSADVDGYLGDPDKDGLLNLLEYAFNLDPLTAETAPPVSLESVLNTDTGLLELNYQFRRLINPGTLTYTILASTDLVTWSVPSSSIIATTANEDNVTETVTVRVVPSAGTKIFLKLQIVKP